MKTICYKLISILLRQCYYDQSIIRIWKYKNLTNSHLDSNYAVSKISFHNLCLLLKFRRNLNFLTNILAYLHITNLKANYVHPLRRKLRQFWNIQTSCSRNKAFRLPPDQYSIAKASSFIDIVFTRRKFPTNTTFSIFCNGCK